MKIITATMASNIAHDFEKNVFKSHVETAMGNILGQAQRGECSIEVMKDVPTSEHAYETLYVFWRGLGYKVNAFQTFYELIW